jgi:hypothetical protein
MRSEVALSDDKAKEFFFQQNQQRFISQPMDARMVAMAGSTALTTANAMSAAQNPGGLGLMRYGDLSMSYAHNEVSGPRNPQGSGLEDKQSMGQVFGATPINPTLDGLPDSGNFGLGWWGRNGDWNNDPSSTNTGSYQVTGAYGKAIDKHTAVGYGLTYQHDSVESDGHDYNSSESFLHTAGVQHRTNEALTIGGVLSIGHGDHRLKHLNDPRDSQTVKQLSLGVGTGAEYTMDSTIISGGLDYTFMGNNGMNDAAQNDYIFGGDSQGHSMNARLGVEERVVDWLALRAGYRYGGNLRWKYDRDALDNLSGSANFNAWSVGAGLHYKFDERSAIRAVNVDYAAEYRAVGTDDWQHIISLSTPFDICM